MNQPGPPTCSVRSEALGEPTCGTAPPALGWIVLEQPGPWGRDAAVQSRLDPELGAALSRRAADAGWRLVLVRAPGPHPATPGARRVMLAGTLPGAAWLEHAEFSDDHELVSLLDVRLEPGFGAPVPEPILLACTNGRRDACCALRGRPLARALHDRLPAGRVWESSHLGGHRFAPTALVLPHGLLYGRLTVAGAEHALREAAAGRVVLDGYRGRSTWSRPAQVAEAAVRETTGELDADALRVLTVAGGGPYVVEVGHTDGRRWRVRVRRVPSGVTRAESCGKPPVPLETWRGSVLPG